jgi:two-component system OmpR family sensor kinase
VSLRLRLLAATSLVALVALVGADIGTYHALRSFLVRRIDVSLNAAHGQIERRLSTSGSSEQAALQGAAPGMFVELRDPEGHTIGAPLPSSRFGGATSAPELPTLITGLEPVPGRGGQPTVGFTAKSTQPDGTEFHVRAWSLANGDQLVLALPLEETAATLHHLLLVEAAVAAAALVAAVGLGLVAVRIGLRPLTKIESTANDIADGDLDRRVPGSSASTEVGNLARALNTMLDQIQGAFVARDATEAELRTSESRLRQFVADASHELRTPVAAVSAYAELFDLGARDHPEDLERVMSGIRKETARMTDLVDELLLLARLDESRDLAREPVELVSLAADAISAAAAIDSEWSTRLEADGAVEVQGDAGRLRQALDNLLTNVRAHTPPSTRTTVTVARRDESAVLRVADTGPGFDAADAPRLFERFYRADPSRSRDRGGSGLGLAIVAAIVHAHDGEVSAEPNPRGGAVFTITLPLAATPAPPPLSSPTDPAGER